MRNGSLVHAALRKFAPARDAALELLSWTDADVVFDRLPAGVTQSIDEPLDFMVIEAARVRDEKQATIGGDSPRLTSLAGSRALRVGWFLRDLRGDAEGPRDRGDEHLGLNRVRGAINFEIACSSRFARARASRSPACNATISDAMIAISTLIADMKLRSATEDVLVTVGNAYLFAPSAARDAVARALRVVRSRDRDARIASRAGRPPRAGLRNHPGVNHCRAGRSSFAPCAAVV